MVTVAGIVRESTLHTPATRFVYIRLAGPGTGEVLGWDAGSGSPTHAARVQLPDLDDTNV
jgi:Cu2+-containing amine oxidase